MNQKNTGEFGSIEGTNRLCIFFAKQIELLEQARISVRQERGERWSVLSPLLFAVCETSGSVLSLAHTGKVRDCYILARTCFETIINICFICAKGEEAVKRAKNHALQKAYRDLNREVDINGQKLTLNWSGDVKPESNPELQAALSEFTSKKGREITSWTPETIQEQIKTINARYGERVSMDLQFALLAIYRHASDIAHGTFFGALFALGLTSPSGPPKSPEELQKHLGQNLSMLLMMLGGATSALLMVLAEEIPSLANLVTESTKEIAELQNEPWLGK